MIRVGVIGCGYWGPNLVRVLHEIEGVRAVAVCDPRPARLEFITSRFPQVRTATSADDLIQSPAIDAVLLATPPHTHYKLACEAIDAGKHVLVEKPITTDEEEAADLIMRAERKGVVLMTGHVFLYSPAVTTIREMLRDGELGEVYWINSIRANLGPPSSTVDVLWDLAPHDLSIILDLIGEFPSQIDAQAAWFVNDAVAETVFLTLRFPSGKIAQVQSGWLTPAKTRTFHMACSKKSVVYDDMEPVEKVRIYAGVKDNRGDKKAANGTLAYGPGSIYVPELPAGEPLRMECEDFIHCIRSGDEPRSGGLGGLEVVRILQAASKIIATQKVRHVSSRA